MSTVAATVRAVRPLWAAIAVAFALRAVIGLQVNLDLGIHRGFDFYGFMADHLLDGRGLMWSFYDGLGEKWANRAPLYPLLVAAVRFVAGRGSPSAVVLVQAAIGALACLVPAAFAIRWGGAKAGLVAVWAAALWPYSLTADTALVEHVVFAPLAGLSVFLALHSCDRRSVRWNFAAGAAAGLATLARLTFAPTAAFLAGACAACRPRNLRWALYAAGTAAVLLPWALRNHHVTGAWVLGTDSGRALWVGNNEATFRSYPAASIDDAERELFRSFTTDDWRRLRVRNDDEVAQDRIFREMALASMATRPAAVAWGGVRKAAALWSPVMNPGPTPVLKLMVFGASVVALFAGTLAAVVGVPRVRADLAICVAAAASFTAVAALFWGQSRYLAPLHGIAIAAAATWFVSRRARAGAVS